MVARSRGPRVAQIGERRLSGGVNLTEVLFEAWLRIVGSPR